MDPTLFLKFLGIDAGLIMIGLGYAWLNPRFYKRVVQIRGRIFKNALPMNPEAPAVGKNVGYGSIFLGIILIVVVIFL